MMTTTRRSTATTMRKHPKGPREVKRPPGRSRGSNRRRAESTSRTGKSKGNTRYTKRRRTKRTTRRGRKPTRGQGGGGWDVQNLIGKLGVEFHVPGYQYLGPGTKLKNGWPEETPASTVWTRSPNSTTSITVMHATCGTSMRPTRKWSKPSIGCPARKH